jgi:hypothetical protein
MRLTFPELMLVMGLALVTLPAEEIRREILCQSVTLIALQMTRGGFRSC